MSTIRTIYERLTRAAEAHVLRVWGGVSINSVRFITQSSIFGQETLAEVTFYQEGLLRAIHIPIGVLHQAIDYNP